MARRWSILTTRAVPRAGATMPEPASFGAAQHAPRSTERFIGGGIYLERRRLEDEARLHGEPMTMRTVDSAQPEPRKKPCNFMTPEQRFRLDEACRVFEEAFDFGVYLVGSVMSRPDFRDVDVRAIVADETFAKLYPEADPKNPQWDAYWALSMVAFSLYLRDATGLPVDFQVQQQTAANEEFPGVRSALGLAHVSRARQREARAAVAQLARERKHEDRCACGGLWVGGVCSWCESRCQCGVCRQVSGSNPKEG